MYTVAAMSRNGVNVIRAITGAAPGSVTPETINAVSGAGKTTYMADRTVSRLVFLAVNGLYSRDMLRIIQNKMANVASMSAIAAMRPTPNAAI